MDKKSIKTIIFVIVCVLIDILGKMVAEQLSFPCWLDSTGTVLAAVVLGPICGGLVGASVNCMFGAFDSIAYAYMLTNVCVGITAGICAKKGMFKKAFNTFSVAMIISLIAAIVSTPINKVVADGMTGNLWGDSVISYFQEVGINKQISSFFGEFAIDLVDKLISAFFVHFILLIKNGAYSKLEKHKKLENKSIAGLLICTIIAGAVAGGINNVSAKEENSRGYQVQNPVWDNGKIDFESYIQTIYNSENGIPGGEVNSIAQTLDGTLWIGTYGGLYQYDGNSFTFMSHFDSVRNVNCLYTDEEGRIWIGTNDGGLSICSKNEIVNVIDEEGGLSANSVRSIVKSSDGYYYIGTSSSLDVVKLADGVKVIDSFDELQYVKKLAANSDGYVCAVDAQGELTLIKNKKVINKYAQNPDGAIFNHVSFDEDGNVYVTVSNSKVEKYKIDGDELVRTQSYDCGNLTEINSVTKTSEGLIFVCADNGIGYIDTNDKFSSIKTTGFESSIDMMLVDYQGNYWFSSSRLGLLKLCESIFDDVFSIAGMEENVVNATTFWDGKFFYGTDSGLLISDIAFEREIKNEISRTFDNLRIRCLMVDSKDNLWISTTGKGVYKVSKDDDEYKLEQYAVANAGIISDRTRSTLELSNGSIAIATDSGVSILKDGKAINSFGNTNGMVTARTLCMYEIDGNLYLGTDGGGVVEIKNDKVNRIIRRADGLGSDIILRIVGTSDKSGLLVVTSNGIVLLNKDGSLRQIKGFPYYNNYDVLRTNDGRLWITSSAGIYIVSEEQFLQERDANNNYIDYELLDSRKGLRKGLTANSWNYVDDQENMYLCCDKGVVTINANRYSNEHTSYRIMLDSILVDGNVVTIDKEETNRISRNAQRIEFCPKVVNYSVNDPYVSVWLEGFDREPRVMLQSELENLVYTNLKAGEYTFHLSILDNKQERIIERVSYSFVKEMEFYDNWWFPVYLFSLVAIILAYLIWLLVGSQINKSFMIQRQEIENMKLKQTAEAALAAGEAKDKFLALMSHDIRTPINAILGMNEMILRESEQQQVYDYATDIKEAGNLLLSIVNTILDFSKIEEGKMEIIDAEYETRHLINNLVNSVKSATKNKGLEFELDIDSNLPKMLYGDDVRVSQIISNLLSNAVKYTERGYVRLTFKQRAVEDDKCIIYCEVKDSGIGIKQEDMEDLFKSFQRLEEKRNRNIEGTGLGMSIVTSLLNLMGSELVVRSEYGKGSSFSFELAQKIVNSDPMGDINDTKLSIHEKKEETHVYAPKAKIMVVDDSSMNLTVAKGLLKITGIVPDTATSGKQAIELARGKKYHIILMDHMMPDMDGIETLQELRKQEIIGADTKVIILTANAINGAREQYIKSGFDDYLSKPIDVTSLEQKLREYLPNEIVEQQATDDAAIAEESNEQKASDLSEDELKLKSFCPELTASEGLKYCMDSWDFYREVMSEVLSEYYYGTKMQDLEKFFAQEDYKQYQIIIHSIKSTSKSIGGIEISDEAKALEFAARDGNYDYIKNNHAKFLTDFKKMLDNIRKYIEE